MSQQKKIYNMEQARESFARCLVINWDCTQAPADFLHKLHAVLQPFLAGQCRVIIRYKTRTEKASLQLGDAWRVHPTDELITRLQHLLERDDAVSIRYR